MLDHRLKRTYFVRTDTGEVVSSRDMYESEQQLEIAQERVQARFLDAVRIFEEKRARDEAERPEAEEDDSELDSDLEDGEGENE